MGRAIWTRMDINFEALGILFDVNDLSNITKLKGQMHHQNDLGSK